MASNSKPSETPATGTPGLTEAGHSSMHGSVREPNSERASCIIDAVRSRPGIYDPKARDPAVKGHRIKLLKEVAVVLRNPFTDVLAEWASLLSTFEKHYRLRSQQQPSEWPLYDKLIFLEPVVQAKIQKEVEEASSHANVTAKADMNIVTGLPHTPAPNHGRSGSNARRSMADGAATNSMDENFVAGFLDEFSSMEQSKRERAMFEISIVMDNIGTSGLADIDGAENADAIAMADSFMERFLDAFWGTDRTGRERAMDEVRVVMYKLHNELI